jgi:Co/Zn/Cd efflux system component
MAMVIALDDDVPSFEAQLCSRASRLARRVLRMTPNERTLTVAIVLFSLITLAQLIGAYYARSNALLIDAASMLVDIASYVTNLWAECSPAQSARRAAQQQVAVSGASLLALWVVTLVGLVQACVSLVGFVPADLSVPDGAVPRVDARIVLGFAAFGVWFDAISIAEFRRSALSARAAREADRKAAADQGARALAVLGARPRGCCGLQLNMTSALAHVLADTCRSLITLVASALTIGMGLNSGVVDALAAVLIASLVSMTALLTTQRWVCTARNLLQRTPLRNDATADDDAASSGFGTAR